jgi:hypothetical protein
MCDRYHPLDWKERLMMELSTLCLSWFALWAFVHVACREGHAPRHAPYVECSMNANDPEHIHGSIGDKIMFSIVGGMVPGLIWWQILFHLYAAPCANIDESQTSIAEVKRVRKIRRSFEILAHFLVLMTCCVVPLHCGVLAMTAEDAEEATQFFGRHDLQFFGVKIPHSAVIMYIVLGRVQAWVFRWSAMFLISFNPLVTIGNPSVLSGQTRLGKFVEFIAIGRWRLQKLRFKYQCLHGIRALESGERSWTFPLTPEDGVERPSVRSEDGVIS